MDCYRAIQWRSQGDSTPQRITWVTNMDICLQPQRTWDHDPHSKDIALAFSSTQFFSPRFIDPFCVMEKVYRRYPKIKHLVIVIPTFTDPVFPKPTTPVAVDRLTWLEFDNAFYYPNTSGRLAKEFQGFPSDSKPEKVLKEFLEEKISRRGVSIEHQDGVTRPKLEQLKFYFVESLETYPQLVPWPEGLTPSLAKSDLGLRDLPIPLLDTDSCIFDRDAKCSPETALAFDSAELFKRGGVRPCDYVQAIIESKYPKLQKVFIVVPVDGTSSDNPAHYFRWVPASSCYLPSGNGRPFKELESKKQDLVPKSWSRLHELLSKNLNEALMADEFKGDKIDIHFVKLRVENGRLAFKLLEERTDTSIVS